MHVDRFKLWNKIKKKSPREINHKGKICNRKLPLVCSQTLPASPHASDTREPALSAPNRLFRLFCHFN